MEDRPSKHEEGGADQSVSKHLEDGSAHAHDTTQGTRGAIIEGEQRGADAEHDDSHVADAGVGDESLQVVLSQTDQCSIEDADRPDDGEDPEEFHGGLGEHLDVAANETVTAHL